MLRNYYINREWLLSPTAQRIYRASASMTLILLLTLVSMSLIDEPVPEGLLPWLNVLLFLGVLGTAITLVAMEYFLFNFDTSSAFKKTFWFCAMLVPLLGPPLYCFFIYLRSEPIRTA